MASIGIKPRVPAIDWSNPITKGLVFDTPMFEKGGSMSELVQRINGTLGSGVSWTNEYFGTATSYNATANGIVTYTTPSAVNGLSIFSIETLAFPIGSSFGRMVRKTSGGATAARFELNANNAASNTLGLTVKYNTTSGSWDWPVTPSNWYHFVTSYDGTSTSNVPKLYVNGKDQGTPPTATQPSGTWATDDTALYLGARQTGAGPYNGKLSHVRIWNRILNAQEAKALSDNPWCIYKKIAQG